MSGQGSRSDLIRVADLTPRKYQIAQLIYESATNKQIAAAASLSIRQVEQHIDEIAARWQLDRGKNLRVQIARKFGASLERKVSA